MTLATRLLHRPPNMRVQRTRSSASPRRSPLTRNPLGRGVSNMHRDIARRPTVTFSAESQEVI